MDHYTEQKKSLRHKIQIYSFLSSLKKNKKDHIQGLPFVLQLNLSHHQIDGPRGRNLLMHHIIEFSLPENNIFYTQANVWPKGMKTANNF